MLKMAPMLAGRTGLSKCKAKLQKVARNRLRRKGSKIVQIVDQKCLCYFFLAQKKEVLTDRP